MAAMAAMQACTINDVPPSVIADSGSDRSLGEDSSTDAKDSTDTSVIDSGVEDASPGVDSSLPVAPPVANSGVITTFATNQGYPMNVFADSTGVYWTDRVCNNCYDPNGKVWQANLDGSSPHTIATGQAVPLKVVHEGNYVYWQNCGHPCAGGISDGTILRIDQGNKIDTLDSNLSLVQNLYVHNGDVFFTEAAIDKIASGKMGHVTIAPGPGGVRLAGDGTTLFWTSYGSSSILSVGVDGGTPTTLAAQQPQPWQIALWGVLVAFSDANTIDGGTTINSMAKDGGGLQTLRHAAQNAGLSMVFAVGGGYVYYFDHYMGQGPILQAVPIAGGAPIQVFQTSNNACPADAFVYGKSFYWTDTCTSTVNVVTWQ